jgi:hypothetical protein
VSLPQGRLTRVRDAAEEVFLGLGHDRHRRAAPTRPAATHLLRRIDGQPPPPERLPAGRGVVPHLPRRADEHGQRLAVPGRHEVLVDKL